MVCSWSDSAAPSLYDCRDSEKFAVWRTACGHASAKYSANQPSLRRASCGSADATRMLNLMANRTVVVLGDSHALNLWCALTCWFYRKMRPSVSQVPRAQPLLGGRPVVDMCVGGSCISWMLPACFASHRCGIAGAMIGASSNDCGMPLLHELIRASNSTSSTSGAVQGGALRFVVLFNWCGAYHQSTLYRLARETYWLPAGVANLSRLASTSASSLGELPAYTLPAPTATHHRAQDPYAHLYAHLAQLRRLARLLVSGSGSEKGSEKGGAETGLEKLPRASPSVTPVARASATAERTLYPVPSAGVAGASATATAAERTDGLPGAGSRRAEGAGSRRAEGAGSRRAEGAGSRRAEGTGSRRAERTFGLPALTPPSRPAPRAVLTIELVRSHLGDVTGEYVDVDLASVPTHRRQDLSLHSHPALALHLWHQLRSVLLAEVRPGDRPKPTTVALHSHTSRGESISQAGSWQEGVNKEGAGWEGSYGTKVPAPSPLTLALTLALTLTLAPHPHPRPSPLPLSQAR